jgi:hypothetical protein
MHIPPSPLIITFYTKTQENLHSTIILPLQRFHISSESITRQHVAAPKARNASIASVLQVHACMLSMVQGIKEYGVVAVYKGVSFITYFAKTCHMVQTLKWGYTHSMLILQGLGGGGVA